MDSFPVEVLDGIFSSLLLQQKLECMLVCRKWANLMRNHFLFDTVTIHWNSALDGFYNLIKEQPWRGAQVKRLILKTFGSSKEKIDFSLFPNLRDLYLNNETDELVIIYNVNDSHQLSPIMNQIEAITDYTFTRFTYRLLSLGTCPNLTTLEIGLMHSNDLGVRNMISVLRNAPSLLNLKMKEYNLRLEDIEEIHTNLPLLQSFKLEGGSMRIISLIDDHILPAACMKSLSTTNVNMISAEPYQWLQYVIQKYTHLLHFRSWRDIYLFQEVFDEVLNEREWILFLKSLGQQVQSLEIDTGPINSNLLEILDDFDYQLEKLAIYTYDNQLFSNMEFRNQCKYINELKLYDVDIFRFELLKELKVMKSLNIRFYERPRIDMSDFLDTCPSCLEILQIESANLECPPQFRNFIFWIKKLIIKDCTLADNIDRFLSYTCLKLRHLAFLSYEPVERDFVMPNLALSRFEILTTDSEKVRHLLVGALDDQYRFYYADDKIPAIDDAANDTLKTLLYDPMKSTPRKSLIWEIYTTLVCASVKTVVFNNRIVC